MTYRIEGLDPDRFQGLIGRSAEDLADHGAMRVIAASSTGYPCRVTLEEAQAGETLILLNYASHDVPTPFRTTYAIFVRERHGEPARYEDRVPPIMERRTLGLRGFDAAGMLCNAVLAMPGEADTRIREMLEDPRIATIHAHNAAHGCFLAAVERN